MHLFVGDERLNISDAIVHIAHSWALVVHRLALLRHRQRESVTKKIDEGQSNLHAK